MYTPIKTILTPLKMKSNIYDQTYTYSLGDGVAMDGYILAMAHACQAIKGFIKA